MGYRKKRGLDLKFPDEFTDSSGEKLAVCIAGGTIEEYFTVRDLWFRPASNPEAVRTEMAGIYDVFGPLLVSWNLEEEDGTPIALTRDTLAAQDRALVGAIVQAWLAAVSGVSLPLEQPSPDGGQRPVESIPTETLSPAPTS